MGIIRNSEVEKIYNKTPVRVGICPSETSRLKHSSLLIYQAAARAVPVQPVARPVFYRTESRPPVVNRNNLIRAAYKRPEVIKHALNLAPEPKPLPYRFASMQLIAPVAVVADAVFIPEVVPTAEISIPNYNLAEATEAYKKVGIPKTEDIIDAEARTISTEQLSVRKFTFNPRGLWARARNFIQKIGVDQILEKVATNLYPPSVYLAEYVRI